MRAYQGMNSVASGIGTASRLDHSQKDVKVYAVETQTWKYSEYFLMFEPCGSRTLQIHLARKIHLNAKTNLVQYNPWAS